VKKKNSPTNEANPNLTRRGKKKKKRPLFYFLRMEKKHSILVSRGWSGERKERRQRGKEKKGEGYSPLLSRTEVEEEPVGFDAFIGTFIRGKRKGVPGKERGLNL